ncbi:MAG: hypothetical protein JWR09_3756 [Mucilaginibacter sp.]|nr:hypothetical protein [Mucilaginibacter sp.]
MKPKTNLTKQTFAITIRPVLDGLTMYFHEGNSALLKKGGTANRVFLSLVIMVSVFITGCNNSPKSSSAAADTAAVASTDTPATILSPVIPGDVQIPAGTKVQPIVFFNDYSWRIFVALTWPAKQDARGVADSSKKISDPGPRVFETYKSVSEVFQPDASEPSDWNVYDAKNPAHITPAFGEIVLGSYNHLDFLGQAGMVAGELNGPVATSNDKYTMVLTGYNENEFNEIKGKKWFLKVNLKDGLRFQNGAIDVKTAWMDMEGLSDAKRARYYTTMAWVMDQDPKGDFKYTKRLVGLVGMHIVQKTPTRPQWIWSTYEQVDNLSGEEGAETPYNYNRAGADTADITGPNPNVLLPSLTWPAKFYNLSRVKPLNQYTKVANARYQKALKDAGSVGQYYKLVMTQWPTPPNKPDMNGKAKNTIPGAKNNDDPANPRPKSDSTSFANITMETYEQSIISTGCMNCHDIARNNADFLFTMFNHAGPKPEIPNDPALLFKSLRAAGHPQSKQMQELEKLLTPEPKKAKH